MKKLILGLLLSQSCFAQNLPMKNMLHSKKEEISVSVKHGQIDMLTGVVYGQVLSTRSARQLKMTILVPRNNDLKPAIVYFPGGGFTSADYDKYYEMKDALARAGFVVAAAEYRVIPNVYPALVNDGKSAVRYLRTHSKELGIDPERIGVLGDSAGGYLSQMMGATNGEKEFDKGEYLDQNSEVQSVVTLYGISNLLNIGEGFTQKILDVHQSPAVTEALLLNGTAFGEFPGASVTSNTEKALKASAMGHIKKGLPPFLIMHGTADKLVSPKQSEQLYNALIGEGNKAQYIVVNGADHGGLMWFQEDVISRVVEWFLNTLGKPKPNPAKNKLKDSKL